MANEQTLQTVRKRGETRKAEVEQLKPRVEEATGQFQLASDAATEARTLLRVKLEDVTGVDEIFTILMGDEVEPRRNFIQTHALEVKNLDV